MTLPSVPPVNVDGFTVTVEAVVPPRVVFSGSGDMEAVFPLNRFLKQLHDELLLTGVSEVHVDLGDLYFLNSSCLKAFVSWVHKVDITGRVYSIRLLMNARQQWQSRSLAALQRLAPNVVSIQNLGD